MSRFDSPLNNIRVASPCSANWDEMYGDERKRFCGECKLHVYNLSGMTRDAAESLVFGTEGQLCVRFYRRRDGSVITQDCPVGWARFKQRTSMFVAAAFSMLLAMFGGIFFVSLASKQKGIAGRLVKPFVSPTPQYQMTMGTMAMPKPGPSTRTPLIGKVRAESR